MLSKSFSRRRVDFAAVVDDEDAPADELDFFVSGGFHSVSPHMLLPI
jgi:hypothetical protein